MLSLHHTVLSHGWGYHQQYQLHCIRVLAMCLGSSAIITKTISRISLRMYTCDIGVSFLKLYQLFRHFIGLNVIFIWRTGTKVVLSCTTVGFCVIEIVTFCIMNLSGEDKTQWEDTTVNSVTCSVIWWKVLFVQPDVYSSLIKDLYFCDN